MRARLPTIDFSRADGRWIPRAPGFAHRLNGASLLLPFLEPYLIKVMRTAQPQLAKVAPELLPDVDVFNRQEANHYKLHAAYTRGLRAQYPGLEPFEAEIRDDFQRFLAEESLAWNLAYCEGFESTGLVSSEFFLQQIDDLLEDADPAVTELWRWHLAEEFEHRGVAHDVLKALYPGWRRRLEGFRYCGQHLFGFTSRVRAHLEQLDQEHGRSDDEDACLAANRALERRERRFQGPRIARVLLPGYSPHPRRTPIPTQRALAAYEA